LTGEPRGLQKTDTRIRLACSNHSPSLEKHMRKLFMFVLGANVTMLANRSKIKGGASSGASDSANSYYYHDTTW
jgi:hypothetical protein